MESPNGSAQRRAPADAIRLLLASSHAQAAGSPLQPASEDGVFPATFFREPRIVVGDTRCLAADLRYACRHDQRTTLLNCANSQALRVFCSQHVIEEVVEHREIWSTKGNPPVGDDEFLRRWDEYLRLVRVVPDDAIPDSWLSPAEHARIAVLAQKDRDDIPSVKLALVTRGLYLSRDADALQAVYGCDADRLDNSKWLERLKAGGDAAELAGLLHGTGTVGYMAAAGVFTGGRRLYQAGGLPGLGLMVAAGYGAWRWIRHPSREGIRNGLGQFMALVGEIAEHENARQGHFDAALPQAPLQEELLASTTHEAVVGRACIFALVRAPRGHLSAQELAAQLRPTLRCSDALVRSVLRDTPCFVEVYRGRWQVGAVHSATAAT